jgi:hypothetical protein
MVKWRKEGRVMGGKRGRVMSGENGDGYGWGKGVGLPPFMDMPCILMV